MRFLLIVTSPSAGGVSGVSTNLATPIIKLSACSVPSFGQNCKGFSRKNPEKSPKNVCSLPGIRNVKLTKLLAFASPVFSLAKYTQTAPRPFRAKRQADFMASPTLQASCTTMSLFLFDNLCNMPLDEWGFFLDNGTRSPQNRGDRKTQVFLHIMCPVRWRSFPLSPPRDQINPSIITHQKSLSERSERLFWLWARQKRLTPFLPRGVCASLAHGPKARTLPSREVFFHRQSRRKNDCI